MIANDSRSSADLPAFDEGLFPLTAQATIPASGWHRIIRADNGIKFWPAVRAGGLLEDAIERVYREKAFRYRRDGAGHRQALEETVPGPREAPGLYLWTSPGRSEDCSGPRKRCGLRGISGRFDWAPVIAWLNILTVPTSATAWVHLRAADSRDLNWRETSVLRRRLDRRAVDERTTDVTRLWQFLPLPPSEGVVSKNTGWVNRDNMGLELYLREHGDNQAHRRG